MGKDDNHLISFSLIDLYKKCGSIENVSVFLIRCQKRSTVEWNTIIVGYALHGYSEEALCMYYKM